MCFCPCPSFLRDSNSEEFTIFFLIFKITSIYLLCVYMYICVPLSSCGGQRITCESWLSSCDPVGPQLVLLMWSCGFPGWNSGYQACQQVPFPAEPYHWSILLDLFLNFSFIIFIFIQGQIQLLSKLFLCRLESLTNPQSCCWDLQILISDGELPCLL